MCSSSPDFSVVSTICGDLLLPSSHLADVGNNRSVVLALDGDLKGVELRAGLRVVEQVQPESLNCVLDSQSLSHVLPSAALLQTEVA
jgi:hypothetical protein